MGGIVQLVIAVLSFVRTLLNLIDHNAERKQKSKEKAVKLTQFNKAMRKAKNEGDTTELEDCFTMLRPVSNHDGVQNDSPKS